MISRYPQCTAAVCTMFALFSSAQACGAAERSVGATVRSTLPTAPRHARQFAFDGNHDTPYISARNPSETDHLTLAFDQPVSATLVALATGSADGEDGLEAGLIEVSADGKVFEPAGKIVDGSARTDLGGRKIRALRIRPETALAHPLIVREIAVVSDPPVVRFRYPVEFVVDVKDAPEMKEWAENTARVCERSYALINDVLRSEQEGYRPPDWVPMSLKRSYQGVAMAGGGRITGSVRYFKNHPDDVGAMVHESVHIVQRYPGGSPSWLVEGVSDYVRFFKFEPEKLGPINAKRAHYNQSYRVSAAFLAYLTDTYDPLIVPKLNKLMRAGKYKETVFQDLTGKTLPQLDEEWRETLARKP